MADSAAIVAKNSAFAMAYIDQPTLSVGAIYIDSGIDVSNVSYTPMRGDTETLDDQSLDGTLVPNIHYMFTQFKVQIYLGRNSPFQFRYRR